MDPVSDVRNHGRAESRPAVRDFPQLVHNKDDAVVLGSGRELAAFIPQRGLP